MHLIRKIYLNDCINNNLYSRHRVVQKIDVYFRHFFKNMKQYEKYENGYIWMNFWVDGIAPAIALRVSRGIDSARTTDNDYFCLSSL